tara:strand:+ start:673 stop:1035 length:363 start_codon:yes stop_codon:yes gene_type:complete
MKYIQCYLRLITWTSKETGEEQSCYAFTTSGATQHNVFGSATSSSLSIRVNGTKANSSQSDVTLWLNDMTEAEFLLYKEQGNDTAYFEISGDLQNPNCTVITTEQFNGVQSPQMLFAQAS